MSEGGTECHLVTPVTRVSLEPRLELVTAVLWRLVVPWDSARNTRVLADAEIFLKMTHISLRNSEIAKFLYFWQLIQTFKKTKLLHDQVFLRVKILHKNTVIRD